MTTIKIEAEFHALHKYEIDDTDPAFGEVDKDEIEKLVKQMLYIDVFQCTLEQDILANIKVTQVS